MFCWFLWFLSSPTFPPGGSSHFSVSFLIVHDRLFYLRAQHACSLALQVSPLFCFPFHLYVPHVSQHTSSLCREDKVPTASVLTACTETWCSQKVRNQPASASFCGWRVKPPFLSEHWASERFSIVHTYTHACMCGQMHNKHWKWI